MATELELQLRNLKPGDHLCSIYENAAELFAAAVPFIEDGLARGERCLYVADDHSVEAIVQALASAGVKVAHERQRGALRMLTKRDSYLPGGKFDPQAMIDFLRSAQAQALADGFSGLRGAGEMTWALGPEIGCDRLIEYEALLNQFLANSRSIALCQYNRWRFDAAVIHDVLRTNPIAVLGDLVCPNPYYEPPELVLSPDPQASDEYKRKRVAWWIEQLKRARAAEYERERALTLLQQSERRLAESQQVAHIGSWEVDLAHGELDPRNGVVTASDELYRLFGLEAHAGNLEFQQFLDRVLPPDRDRVLVLLNDAIGVRRGFSFDYRITRADGGVRVLHQLGNVILKAEGEPFRLVGTAQDVTEQKNAQEEMKRQKEQMATQLAELEQIYACAPVGLCFIDRNLRYVRINEQLAAMNGLTAAEHIGRTIREIVPHIDEVEPLWKRVVTVGEPVLNVEVHGMTAAEPGVERHWLVNYVPVRSESGAVVGGTGAVMEITKRKRSEEQVREYAQRVQDLSRRLLSIQEEERAHLARELHDEVGQLLTGLRLLLKPNGDALSEEGRSKREQALAIVDTLLDKVRGLSFDLRPAVLDQLGLFPALLELFENYTRQTGVQVNFKHKDVDKRFTPEVETTAYRIVQEALTNVARHAGAGGVTVRVWATQDQLSVQIEDQGRGFDPETVLAVSRSSGLAGMRERVMLLSGELTIDSRPDGGTQITAELPLGRPNWRGTTMSTSIVRSRVRQNAGGPPRVLANAATRLELP